jgi:NAD(P)-dependent dehydrogenase (short-subunit alcohol dehydrogenase family)
MSVVVITGCGSGIGFEAALAFARNGDTVVATFRDTDKATELLRVAAAEKLDMRVMQLDVTRSGTFDAVVARIIGDHGRIDVLVNNAGIHRAGVLEDFSEDDLRIVMETNCLGPLLLTKTVLPHMRQQNSGLIIMMSSLSGIAGLPGDLPYAASKFALEGATEALRHEVDRWGIRVALVEAGPTRTNIMAHNLRGKPSLPAGYPEDSPYRPLIEWQLDKLLNKPGDAFDPADVAALFVRIATSPDPRLRWPADPVAEKVMAVMLRQDDSERDEYLRDIAGSDWWSRGKNSAQSV